SSANYASALVAEAPATKQLEHFQHLLAGALGTRRTRPNRSLAWQQLGLAVDVGLLPREVLRLIQTGLPAKIIASQLMISIFTVNQHLRSIYRKLNVRNKMEAVQSALSRGML
ncbi:MAG: response regulator transcription factor, partial [Limnohabitans sp.]|nr:response regulator transcription factor [Limnohabitans sp.]